MSKREEYAKQHGEEAAAKVDRILFEALVKAAAAQIQETLVEEGMEKVVGFTVIMFEFGPPGGALAYASTAQRDDFLRVLDEMRGKLANMTSDVPKGD